MNEVIRKYYVDDDNIGAILSRRMSLAENAPGRLHYCVWVLNNDLEYFFRSPTPFLKAAVMLPIVARFSGRPLRRALNDLEKFPAKILVCLALPLASLIYGFDRVRTLVKHGATATTL